MVIERNAIMSDTSESTPAAPGRATTVAIVGFGTVGQSVARILCSERSDALRLTHVCNRSVARKRVDWVPADVVWTERFEDLLAPDAGIDVIVEVVGGVEPATSWIRAALEHGTSVVTANKQVIAQCGPALQDVAATHRCTLAFEAAVAGGIPIIRGLREGLAGDRLLRVLGILNGTCNYILTRMEADQVPFADALKEAQDLGYAEADPTADVDGLDAQAKVAILSAVALGRQIDVGEIPLQTIRSIDPIDFVYARRLECTIRQVARAELVGGDQTRVFASVQPTLVPTLVESGAGRGQPQRGRRRGGLWRGGPHCPAMAPAATRPPSPSYPTSRPSDAVTTSSPGRTAGRHAVASSASSWRRTTCDSR